MKELQKKIQKKFDDMCSKGILFRSAVSGRELWDLYLKSFPPDKDPVFRDPLSTSHNCNLCNNFIRRYGNVVALDENFAIITMFDVETDSEYGPSMKAMSDILKASSIEDVFYESFEELNSLNYEKCKKNAAVFRLGLGKNTKLYNKEEAEKYGVVKEGEVRDFHHFHVDIPSEYVLHGVSLPTRLGKHRDDRSVFLRTMVEVPMDTLNLVSDLIKQGSLLDGPTHLPKVTEFTKYKKIYDGLAVSQRENWTWVASHNLNIARFRNELIGTFCVDLAEGKELNEACKVFNIRVDPTNYMKATAPITKKQIEEAEKFVEENGYAESFKRRFATIDDINVNEILHTNVSAATGPSMKPVSVFEAVKGSAAVSTRHKKSEFDKVETVGIEKFMTDILPTCTSIELFLKASHENNLVSLTTADNPDSKGIFKWDNNFSWTFKGNLAGKSMIKQAVKTAGGNVDGVLRFSMIWNEEGTDRSDLDAWCNEPFGSHIGYSAGYRRDRGNIFSPCGGQLDLDNTDPGSNMGIENIYYPDTSKMKNGVYRFYVHQFSARSSKGFRAEIEMNGEIFSYEYKSPLVTSKKVPVAEVTFDKGAFTIKHLLPETSVSKTIYGLETEQFHKVNLVCLSPNHWGEKPVGNKHYMFMLHGCKADGAIRGFHNENLSHDLLTHRKVMEVMGSLTFIDPSDKQLSGLGFNATVRDEIIVKLGGTHKRVLKVQF